MERRTITVGQISGDLIGRNQLPIQAAIDYLSYLGGGTVYIGEGVYDIDTSVHLRSGVHLEGVPGKTVFRKNAEVTSPLIADADLHERQITVAHPELFSPGQNVTIVADDSMGGFSVTVAVITGKEGNVCCLDRQIQRTVLVAQNARALTNFPVISGYDCRDAAVRHIEIDGNKAQNGYVEGCRNAGIFLMDAKRIAIEDCTVRDYNGDGISYQCCEDIIVRRCACLNNSARGVHPGSGTQRTIIADSRFHGNGTDGIFLCWRVTDSLVENNDASGNGRCGLSIGHKDTHNVIRNNRFCDNKFYGIFFRNEPDPMGANYNRVENNYIKDNGSDPMGYVGIRLRGGTKEVDIVGNTIVFEQCPPDKTIGICIEDTTRDIRLTNNEFIGCAKETHNSWVLVEQ